MAWIKNNESEHGWELYIHYYSNSWQCTDGDYATLILTYETSMKEPNKFSQLELHCFSGTLSSYIVVDSIDFSWFFHKADILKPDMTDEEMVFKIADYLCEMYCEKRS
jgi:hypothetical protein